MHQTTVVYLFCGMLLSGFIGVWPSDTAPTVGPDEALKLLTDGNDRYVTGAMKHSNQDQARRTLTATGGQHPYATVLNCSDSRVPTELLFDCGIGEIFVVRVAGNVADVDELGTLEYGAGHLKTPLIAVVGHTHCGAVTAVMTDAKVGGNIPGLVSKIFPVSERIKKAGLRLSTDELVAMAIRENVWQAIEDILNKSEEIKELVIENKVKVVGGVYDLESGKVTWMGEHPSQKELLSKHTAEPAKPLRPKPAIKPPAAKNEGILFKDSNMHHN